MSLKIRRIALTNFRKFRDPFVLDGLTDGLNVIIEPNETGKSTLLEAMRAAFFIRHNTANRLARSYAPHGEAVAPQIEIGFEARGDEWQVNKRFLKGASVEVRGPNGRAQGEDAEAQLQALLGARRDTSQAGDAAAHGALGLLWVGQAQALEVTAPGDIVRDSVRATLEAEVGTIMPDSYVRCCAPISPRRITCFLRRSWPRRRAIAGTRARICTTASSASASPKRLASSRRRVMTVPRSGPVPSLAIPASTPSIPTRQCSTP